MVEQTEEIVTKFNSIYGDVLVMPKILLPSNANCMRLVGTDGKAKMSKSLGNCIYISDDAATVKKKVMSMYTDPNHIQVSDPGDTKNNPVFLYLSCFADDSHFEKYLPEYKNLDEMKAHYERGGLGDVKCKKLLINVLEELLAPIREKRAYYEAHLDEVFEVLKKGTVAANAQANATLEKVRAAMKINYFEDPNFLSDAKAHFGNKA